jgi:hypothetical protein
MMYLDALGQIIILYGFSGEESGGAPHEITPEKGDTFTILETWIVTDKEGSPRMVQHQGGTLLFGKKGIEWFDYDAPPGGIHPWIHRGRFRWKYYRGIYIPGNY